ncbi:hypothetical protein KY290_000590 [Solanum tuberosum]|uniref:Uncharacterized protein n=1 Tax=Solanum tuberosum TaxID=4113 RepID=A0ABQ7WM03_SOLTU|nr:hypothetical protein KY290_000590 [Solanum tuberosum]
MLKPLEGTTFGFGHESSQKMCAYHLNQRGHTIEECVELKAAIRNLINIGKIPYMWGENIVLTCDQPEPSMPSISSKGVFASIIKDDEEIDPVGIEIWKPCPYHDAIDHNIGRCLGFRYDVESLINMGKIQVEFTPRD